MRKYEAMGVNLLVYLILFPFQPISSAYSLKPSPYPRPEACPCSASTRVQRVDALWTVQVGTQGTPGTRNTQGTPGNQGTPGTRSTQGTLGPLGTRGSPGRQGTPGNQGTRGTQGDPGEPRHPSTQGIQRHLGTQALKHGWTARRRAARASTRCTDRLRDVDKVMAWGYKLRA